MTRIYNKKKSLKSKSKKPIKAAKTTAWNWFSKYIRLRDAMETTGSKDRVQCCTCGAENPTWGDDVDAGHFIPGRHNAILFDERGVHAQCKRCNHHLGGNPVRYYQFMERKYGIEVIEELNRTNHNTRNFKEWELREISDKYREAFHILEKERTEL